KFAWRTLKANGEIVWRLLACAAYFADVVVECGFPAAVGMLPIRSRQFKHAADWKLLFEPLSNLGIKHRHRAAPVACFRLLLYFFSQHPRNRIPVVTGKFSDLDIGPAFLFQVVNR